MAEKKATTKAAAPKTAAKAKTTTTKAPAKTAAKKTTAAKAAKPKAAAEKKPAAKTTTAAKAKTTTTTKAPAKTTAKPAAEKKAATKAAVKKTPAKVPAKKASAAKPATEPKVKAPAKKEKIVTVHGYVEFQQPLPVVKVFENGNQIAKLKRLEKLVLGPIDKDTTLEFKTLFHKASITIPASDPKDVQLSYSTLTGKIKAILTDDVDELQEKLNHEDEKNRKKYIIICISVAVALFVLSCIVRCTAA
ncbi:MAG: hypothetical protein PUD17_07680 [Treponema sp.]|uniref:hypothetical protein n=1 Tax=Treponema sp. TaxID=166 RepID=UPI00298E0BD6|nr:hypothetical protein [Treponema sp.]MDD5811964.1 hypothetical protein [Treponema sp.]